MLAVLHSKFMFAMPSTLLPALSWKLFVRSMFMFVECECFMQAVRNGQGDTCAVQSRVLLALKMYPRRKVGLHAAIHGAAARSRRGAGYPSGEWGDPQLACLLA